MVGEQTYQVKRTLKGTRVKGRTQEGTSEEIPLNLSLMPATPKETMVYAVGGQADPEVYKGYIEGPDGMIRGVSKREGTPADEVFFRSSWWKVVKVDYYPPPMEHSRFMMIRED